ncbi:hypothetical protein D3C78_777960 [compost metagenome]
MGEVKEQVARFAVQVLAGNVRIAVEHVACNHRAVQRVATEDLGVDGDRGDADCQVMAADFFSQFRGAQPRISHLAAKHVGFLAGQVQGVAQVVQRTDAGRGFAVVGCIDVIRVAGFSMQGWSAHTVPLGSEVLAGGECAIRARASFIDWVSPGLTAAHR